jgi:hypothetical protein
VKNISTNRVVLEAAREKSCGQDLVDWAAQQIRNGVDSPHLRLLAGATHPYNHFELVDWRVKTFLELGIQVPSLDAAIGQYAAERLEAVSSAGDEALIAVVAELKDLCIETDYNREIYDFYILYFAREDLKDLGHTPHLPEGNSGNILSLTRTAMEKCIGKYGKKRGHPA